MHIPHFTRESVNNKHVWNLLSVIFMDQKSNLAASLSKWRSSEASQLNIILSLFRAISLILNEVHQFSSLGSLVVVYRKLGTLSIYQNKCICEYALQFSLIYLQISVIQLERRFTYFHLFIYILFLSKILSKMVTLLFLFAYAQ